MRNGVKTTTAATKKVGVQAKGRFFSFFFSFSPPPQSFKMRRFQINHAKVSTSRPRGRGTRPPAGAPAAGLPEPRSAADLPATAAARRVQHPKATPEPAERSDSDVLLTATLPGAPRTARAPTTGATSPSHADFVVFFFPPYPRFRISRFATPPEPHARFRRRRFRTAGAAHGQRVRVQRRRLRK